MCAAGDEAFQTRGIKKKKLNKGLEQARSLLPSLFYSTPTLG